MPLAGPGVQAHAQDKIKFTDEQIAAAGGATSRRWPRARPIPDAQYTDPAEGGDIAQGGEIFRVNCAMCHNFAGAGGALTRGKYAPTLAASTGKHIYEAMVTGPAVDAGVQRHQHHPGEQAEHHRLPERDRQRDRTPAASPSATSARSPRGCSSGSSGSAS